MARIYAASSWRNKAQPSVVEALRGAGHEVYDFRNPFNGRPGFAWSEIDPEWQSWTAEKYRELLTTSPIAAAGYVSVLRQHGLGRCERRSKACRDAHPALRAQAEP
jgi:hypothetical protein